MAQHPKNLIWIDLEMTGLSPDTDTIIEIATVVTDNNLRLLAEGPELVLHHPDATLARMDQWNTRQHTASGLVDRVRHSTNTLQSAAEKTLAFVREWVPEHTSPMCGNTICQDRRFLARWMPNLEAWFHYRNIDVSTLKELCQRWAPQQMPTKDKTDAHRALSDILESIDELRYYRDHFLRIGTDNK